MIDITTFRVAFTLLISFGTLTNSQGEQPIHGVAELVAAIEHARANPTDRPKTIELAAETFELTSSLNLPPGITLRGAGIDQTVLTHARSWRPSTEGLPDPEMKRQGLDEGAYLIRCDDKAAGIEVSHLTLRGPQMHGAVFAWANDELHLHHLKIDDTLWCGVRTFSMTNAKIHDCEFVDAGGRWSRGQRGEKGGITGGAIFAVWMKDSDISHNRFVRTQMGKADEFYGIKVRQGKRCRVHHNTIDVNFSIEFPFENDEDVEIDHNVCSGTVSIPKHAGGPVPDSGRTFHIHHNLFRDSYSIEFVRNGVMIDHNVFDFDIAKDHGNLISGFGKAFASGPAVMHNNLIRNPGRGVVWINEPYGAFVFRNNDVLVRTTVTPRREGLFGLHRDSDFSMIEIHDNRIVCEGLSRPLLRHDHMAAASIENNDLVNVSDTAAYENASANRPVGLQEPLQFECGMHGEVQIDSNSDPVVSRKLP